MSALMNLREVFGLAIQIESNGAAFYRKAAAGQKNAAARAYLEELAGMEDEHKRVFTEMRKLALAAHKEGAEELRPEGGLFLAAVMDGFSVEGSPSVADKLTGRENLTRLLEVAVDLEKQAILFYLGLKDAMAGREAKAQLDRIIREEKAHVITLTAALRNRRQA